MPSSPSAALRAVEVLIAVAGLLQTLELWIVRRAASDDGVWRWADLRRELDVFPRPLRGALDRALAYRGLLVQLAARLVAAVVLLLGAGVVGEVAILVATAALLATTALIALRWRGSYNGGSDFMTLVVLGALTVAAAAPGRPLVALGCTWWIALQTCNSYVVAGLVKLRAASWRRGAALPAFVRAAVYPPSPLGRLVLERPAIARAASWAVIAAEIGFPLALVDPSIAAVVLAAMLGFHLANAHVFGLSRFLFAWAATYPAVYACGHLVAAALG